MAPASFLLKVHPKPQFEEQERVADHAVEADVDVDLREVYFLIMHFLSSGPCQRTCGHFLSELLEHQLLPRRYHAWYERNGAISGDEKDDGISFPLNYDNVVERFSHIEKDHLVKLLKQLILSASPLQSTVERAGPSAVDVPTLLGIGPFSLLGCANNKVNAQAKHLPAYLRWPHMQADQVRGLSLREIGGGFRKHHRAPSIRYACYAIAKPSTMVQKMQNIKKIRGHRNAVYCAIFDRSGRYVITGSDDRLVKIWSMETAFCLTSCRGHEGDITDLAVSSNNVLVASASNDYSIRVWRLPDGMPISVLRGHKGAVTAIAFSPKPNSVYQLLSSSDDGTCRIWDARYSQCSPRIYLPKPTDALPGKINGPSSSSAPQNHQILCCAYNSNGTVFVTGSSDTFARVWSAGKSNTEDIEQPNHEIDILAGHENDVNYVQFSGCAVASRSSISDSLTEENVPKFKNSWYSHDYIVTCSRDGSAIIWIPRARRCHGKVGRWTRAYHLKVPPPPMPPQPPRGGPRQRFLPTPRGVNMIVWSLDNRFVLAAIMDCRICVWNASDGSLVHSLTGHSASTYVLDVHPFNPRIAMSAGYDGKTIVWDIWEGTPIRIYEIGRFKLVDGKFSPDGTSIVLSDDVGQIYLLNTGQGESQKDAKYDQFFLGDYRPLIQDAQGNVVDQETQLPPYRRNMQDPLCDSSLLPYPDPYQNIYQRRRLGALGIEWRPSSVKFAVGTDIGLGQEYQVLPLADLDIVIEPLPEFIDAMYWEPEIDAINDDTDSEYNVTEEYSSEEEQGNISNSSSSDPEGSEEDQNGLRRSKRKKSKVELMTSSGRRVKRRNLSEHDGTSCRSKRAKKSKKSPRKLRRKVHKTMPLRPQRVAARNAVNISSSGEDEDEDEDEDVDEDEYESEDVSSESGSLLQDSDTQNNEPFNSSQIVHQNDLNNEQASLDEFEDIVNPPKPVEVKVENRKRLVLKISVRNPKKSLISESSRIECDNQDNLASSSSRHNEETSKENMINLSSGDPGPSSASVIGADLSENHSMTNFREGEEITNIEDHLEPIEENPKPKRTILKIKSKSLMDSKGPSKVKFITTTPADGGEFEQNLVSEVPEVDEGLHSDFNTTLDDDVYASEKKSHKSRVSNGGEIGEGTSTDATRRARSLRLKATSRETNDLNKGLISSVWASKSAVKSSKKSYNQLSSDQWMTTSTRTRSTRNKGKSYYDDQSGALRKSNWLLLSEQEEGYRYIPQLGDEVVYMRQGHQEYEESSHPTEVGSWARFGDKIRAVEVCLVEELDYATLPGSGESGCKITLAFIDSSSRAFGKTLKLTLPELINFTDFVVEKTWYDAAIMRNWCSRDKCLVWWRYESEEGGGSWWDGRIVLSKDKSSEFPGSPWQRYLVTYNNDNTGPHHHSPWELHDLGISWEQPHIDSETRNKMLSYFAKLHQSASSNKDNHGILKLKQVAQKSDFLNRFPVPLSLEIIESRLENSYYRSLDAMKHDMEVMLTNARTYFAKNAELLAKMRRLSDWFMRTLSKL